MKNVVAIKAKTNNNKKIIEKTTTHHTKKKTNIKKKWSCCLILWNTRDHYTLVCQPVSCLSAKYIAVYRYFFITVVFMHFNRDD